MNGFEEEISLDIYRSGKTPILSGYWFKVVIFRRIWWSLCTGSGGHFRPDQVVTFNRIWWSLSAGSGKIVSIPHLQFEIINKSGVKIKISDIKLSYFGSDDRFIGSDEAFEYSTLELDEIIPVDMCLSIPEKASYAKIDIIAEKIKFLNEHYFLSLILIGGASILMVLIVKIISTFIWK